MRLPEVVVGDEARITRLDRLGLEPHPREAGREQRRREPLAQRERPVARGAHERARSTRVPDLVVPRVQRVVDRTLA